MNQSGRADKLILRPEQKDLPPGKVIMEHIGIICRNWCRKNKIEISWIVLDGLTGDEFDVTEEIYSQYLLHPGNYNREVIDYNYYSDFVIMLLKQILNKGFKEFNQLLVKGDNKTWKLADRTLRKYTWIWAKNKGISFNEDINACYIAALSTLYEKLSSKKMTFTNSSDLKSYYFKILENKTKEYHRINSKYTTTTSSFPELIYEETDNKNDEMLAEVKKNIRKLDYNEQYILMAYFLYKKKLTEIAAELGITVENCRVIKHRTINRLIKYLPKEI